MCDAKEEGFETVPTFRPTIEEMQDFDKYLFHLFQVHHCDEVGLTKIIPPKEWNWEPCWEHCKKMTVRNPIQQCVTGRSGMYNVRNVVKPDLSVQAYFDLAQQVELPAESFNHLFELERKFWKSLTCTGTAPLYGSDVEGTLFGEEKVEWNVNTLQCCCLKQAGIDIPGITTPMMYVGMWRSFFPFHVEDVNMFSVNVLHMGRPKIWYGVPPALTKRMESLARSSFPEESCKEMLRHKTILFSPQRLKDHAISFVRCVQRPGEIVITWPSSFHGGFNSGFNIAEAVNFCPPSLVPLFLRFAKQAKFCKCRPDSVVINLTWLEKALVQNWIQCTACDKWRQMSQPALSGKDDSWECSHVGYRCTDPEEGDDTTDGKRLRVNDNKDEKEDGKEECETYDTVKVANVGDWLEMLEDDEWFPVRVVAVVENCVRLHRFRTSKECDEWIQVGHPRLRKPIGKPETSLPPPAACSSTLSRTPRVSQASTEVATQRRLSTRALVSHPAYLTRVQTLFTHQQRSDPILPCSLSPKKQWVCPLKLKGVTGLKSSEQSFQVVFRAVVMSQKLIGVNTIFKDPRDAHQVYLQLTELFAGMEGEPFE